MIITEIYTEGFRNLSGKLTACPGINILCGDNAQGKTNWLEAIYLLASTKSFRTSSLKDTLRLNTPNQNTSSGLAKQAYIRGSVIKERLKKDLQVHLEESTKSFYINGKREAITRYIGNLDVVVFCAEEMEIVRGEPSERRRFLDRGVLNLFPAYLKVLSEYNRILKQKNALLKQAQESPQPKKFFELIETWNEQLIDFSTQIHIARLDYTKRLRKMLNKQLFSQKQIDIKYISALSSHGVSENTSKEEYKKIISQRMKIRLENEVSLGYSLIGPHRDELEILIDSLDASKFGSSGEQRSALITLDLAQISLYHQVFEEYPVFLIDDIDAELDLRRISLLLNHLTDKMQVFISTSKREIATQYQNQALCSFISQGNIAKNSEISQNDEPNDSNDTFNGVSKESISGFNNHLTESLTDTIKEHSKIEKNTTESLVAKQINDPQAETVIKVTESTISKAETVIAITNIAVTAPITLSDPKENSPTKTPPSKNTVSAKEDEKSFDPEDRHRAPF